jgi:sulfoxide reductase heme-binding subunit YedZ
VRFFDSRLALWILLAAPGLYWLVSYWRDPLAYGEVVHATGVLAAQLLIFTLAITPIARLMPAARWIGWLRRRRRYLGVAAFGYALLHAVVYFERQPAFVDIFDDAKMSAMWTGWAALAIMLPLAATSNNQAMRWLRWRWQLLHRAVYIAAVLSFLHWVLSAFDPVPGYIHFALLAVLETLRLGLVSRRLRTHRHR